jgi:hypothetical protein
MMLKRLTVTQLAVVATAVIVAACAGEQALLVSPHPDGAPPLGIVDDPAGARVHPVRRQNALASDQSWSFDVGPSGATVQSTANGLTIVVPPGALSAPTRITVTALKGAPLAYRFEPHGLQFAVPLALTQSLHGLIIHSLAVPQLFAGYFAGDSLPTDAATGDARVIEVLPVLIDVRAHAAILYIRHFSGYTVASASADSVHGLR